ncbi:ATP-binding cassette sub-family C member Sur [Symbiodinium microadriaticum]|uniref:ATP-binding cassette sub-family C member Sur n=1 Tax=Symbiodinium microadriaticum TaxID=2951 RepID=A0A1Q9ENC8_SYMMI|nr:ATP-binding cassette sub-family C member Sur [Symbiodinium microadriaticum]
MWVGNCWLFNDEPQSAEFCYHMNNRSRGSTLIAVAHRLETIRDFDKVVVLEAGAVAEQGTLKEMTERKDSIFRKMLAAKRK